MTDLNILPLQDGFQTTLAQAWDWATGTMYVNAVPSFTFPSGVTTYVVVDPGKSNMQVAEIDSYDGWAKTLNVTDISLEKWAWLNYSGWSHAAGASVIISDNYEFWKAIRTAINSKADSTDLGDFTFSWDDISATGTTMSISQTGSNFRIRRDGNSMKFRDNETAEVTLKQLAEWNWADQFFSISENDTTVWHFEDKVVSGAGITQTKNNPWASETMSISVDTSDTGVFVKTSSGAADENKVPVLDATGKLDANFISWIQSSYTLWETMTAADIAVLRSDGNIYKFNWLGTNWSVFTADTITSNNKVIMVDTNTIVVVFYDTGNNDIHMRAGTISAGTITWWTEVNIDTAPVWIDFSVCKVDTNSWVVFYHATASILRWTPFTVSWNTVTLWTPSTINTASTSNLLPWEVVQVNTNKVLFTYLSGAAAGNNCLRCATVAGNALTLGTEITSITSFTNGAAAIYPRVAKLADDKAIFVWIDNASDICTNVLSISGTTITMSAQVKTAGTAVRWSVYQVWTDLVMYVYDETDLKARYISVSGTTATHQTAYTIKTSTVIGSAQVRPLIQLNNNIYWLLGATNNITYFFKNDTTYKLTPITTIDYWQAITSSTFAVGNFSPYNCCFWAIDSTGKKLWLTNFDSHYLLGILQESWTTGQSKKVSLPNQISTVHTSLSVWEKYYIYQDGTYTLDPTILWTTAGSICMAGKALIATTMLVNIPYEDL